LIGQAASAPNIVARARNHFVDYNLNCALSDLSGAFSWAPNLPKSSYTDCRPSSGGNYRYDAQLEFNASLYDKTYGRREELSPSNLTKVIWVRTA